MFVFVVTNFVAVVVAVQLLQSNRLLCLLSIRLHKFKMVHTRTKQKSQNIFALSENKIARERERERDRFTPKKRRKKIN